MGRVVLRTNIEFLNFAVSVGLESSRREDKLSFNQLCPVHKLPINYVVMCHPCNKEYQRSELLKGYKIDKDTYKPIPSDLFEKIETSNIRVHKFIKPSKEVFFDIMRAIKQVYFVKPQKNLDLKRYSFFHNLLNSNQLIALGKLNAFRNEHYIALMPYKNIIILYLLFYPHELLEVPSVELDKNIAEGLREMGKDMAELTDNSVVMERELDKKVYEYVVEGKEIKVRPQKPKEEKDLEKELEIMVGKNRSLKQKKKG